MKIKVFILLCFMSLNCLAESMSTMPTYYGAIPGHKNLGDFFEPGIHAFQKLLVENCVKKYQKEKYNEYFLSFLIFREEDLKNSSESWIFKNILLVERGIFHEKYNVLNSGKLKECIDKKIKNKFKVKSEKMKKEGIELLDFSVLPLHFMFTLKK